MSDVWDVINRMSNGEKIKGFLKIGPEQPFKEIQGVLYKDTDGRANFCQDVHSGTGVIIPEHYYGWQLLKGVSDYDSHSWRELDSISTTPYQIEFKLVADIMRTPIGEIIGRKLIILIDNPNNAVLKTGELCEITSFDHNTLWVRDSKDQSWWLYWNELNTHFTFIKENSQTEDKHLHIRVGQWIQCMIPDDSRIPFGSYLQIKSITSTVVEAYTYGLLARTDPRGIVHIMKDSICDQRMATFRIMPADWSPPGTKTYTPEPCTGYVPPGSQPHTGKSYFDGWAKFSNSTAYSYPPTKEPEKEIKKERVPIVYKDVSEVENPLSKMPIKHQKPIVMRSDD